MVDEPASVLDETSPRRAWFWPAFIVGLLVVQVLTVLTVAFVATRDPSFAVEPNYYQKGLQWDAQAAQQRVNAELGWTLAVALNDEPGPLGDRVVTFTLADAAGEPIDAATLAVEAFAHRRGEQRLNVAPVRIEAGRYEARMKFHPAGLWSLRVAARKGDATFTWAEDREIYPPGKARPWRP